MISNGLNEFKGKRVLMLQGPVGPFFARFATDLALAGAVVFKVNFNGGDWLFSRSRFFTRVFDFTQDLAAWPGYFDDLLGRLNIDTVFLFGDCRPVHVAALAVIQRRGLQVGVFEEGYLRPDYITLERDGVNRNSSLPNNPKFYLDQPAREFAQAEPLAACRTYGVESENRPQRGQFLPDLQAHSPAMGQKDGVLEERRSQKWTAAVDSQPTFHKSDSLLGSTYGQAAKWGMLYFAATSLGRFRFWRYQHHRRIGFSDGPSWLLSFWRKHRYRFSEAPVLPHLVAANSGNFFLVSLQTRGDAQMSVHSAFESVDQFIEHVMASFARGAPAGRRLALKHHPLDRGYSDYSALIERLKVRYQLQDRCHYIHDQHLPLLLQHTCGVVVVNSTAGLSAVGEGVPVKVCGEAIYDIQGLTFQGSLDDFWKHAHLAVPNARLYDAFRRYLISHTQHRGSFYKPLPGVSCQSGVIWADHGASAPHHGGQDARQKERRSKFSREQRGTP